MQAQAYEGYVEGGQFYPKETPIRLTGRFRAVLTVLDVPAQVTVGSSSRIEWLNHLEAAVALSADEELPDWPFERSKEMRPPLDLAD
ncbi:MAG: hypothetical protein FWF81_05930 [Defluviitaleaceae bacterium]|nr:hypothetical protein [Defluviitaleaceae bacterium]